MLEAIQFDVAEKKTMRDYIASMPKNTLFSCSRKYKGPFYPRIVVSWCMVGLPPPEWFWAGVQRAYLSLDGCGLGYNGLTSP